MIKEDISLPIKNQRLGYEAPAAKATRFIKNCSPVDIFPDFKKGYSAFGMNNGSFGFGDIIEYILNKTGPAHALIASWVANQMAMQKVAEYLDNYRFLSVRFLLDRMFANSRADIYKYVIEKFGVDCIRTTRLHAKFCCLYNADWAVVIETSANLNKNLRLESFRITEDKDFLIFFKELFDNLFNILAPKHNCHDAAVASRSDLNKLPDINSLKENFEPDLYSRLGNLDFDL
jgi:hypothetical protein